MKQTFKNYFKLGVLLLGISLTLVNCQKDDDIAIRKEDSFSKSRFSISKILTSEIFKNKSLINKLNKIDEVKKRKLETSISNREVYSSLYDFTINTDYANYLEDSESSYHSYTFPISRNVGTPYVENLLFSLQEDGTYKTSIVTYNVTNDEKESLNHGLPVDLEGKISFTEIDGDNLLIDIFGKFGCTYSIEEYCNCNVHPNENGFSGCHSSCYEIIVSESCVVDTSGGAGGDTSTDSTSPTDTDTTNPSGSGYTPPTTTFTPCEDCPEFVDNDPCEELQKLFEDDVNNDYTKPNIKPIIQQLETTLGYEGENGANFNQNNDATGTPNTYDNPALPANPINSIDVPNECINTDTTTSIYGGAHTHPITTYSMFSFSDILVLKSLYTCAPEELKNSVVFTLTATNNQTTNTNYFNPVTYAIKIDDISIFNSFKNSFLQGIKNSNSNYINADYKKLLRLAEVTLQDAYDESSNLELTFLTFFEAAGISIYKANSTLDNWSKLSSDPLINGTVLEEPCN